MGFICPLIRIKIKQKNFVPFFGEFIFDSLTWPGFNELKLGQPFLAKRGTK